MKNTNYETALWGFSWDEIRQQHSKCEQGVANLTDEGVVLEIPFGQLLSDSAMNALGASALPSGADYLYGFSQNGDYLVLKDVISKNINMCFPGGFSQTMIANYLLSGRTSFDPSSPVKRATVSLLGLEQWAQQTPLSMMFDKDSMAFKSINYDYENQDSYDMELLANEYVSVKLIHFCGPLHSNLKGVSVGHGCRLAIEYKTIICLDDSVAMIARISQFLSYCMGISANIEEICLSFDDCNSSIKCFADFYSKTNVDEKDIKHIPLPLPDIKEYVPVALDRWLNAENEFLEACKINTSLLTQAWDFPNDLKFIASAQALEALCRVDTDLKALPDDVYESYRKTVLDSISNTKIKNWVSSRLSGNQKGQRRLLNELIDTHIVVAGSLIGNTNEFIESHMATRNYYTHRSDDPNSAKCPLDGSQLYWHTEAVLLLGYCVIGETLGFDSETLIELITKSHFKDYSIRRVREMYKADSRCEESGEEIVE